MLNSAESGRANIISFLDHKSVIICSDPSVHVGYDYMNTLSSDRPVRFCINQLTPLDYG